MSNIEIVKKVLQAWENDDEATVSSLTADDFEMSGPLPEPIGKATFVGMMHVMNAGLSEFSFNAFDYEEAGETVTVKSRISATHTGTLAMPGLPAILATGKKIQLPEEVLTYTLKNGKLSLLTTDGRPDGGVGGILAQIGVPLPH